MGSAYRGKAGASYFRYQASDRISELTASKFRPLIHPSEVVLDFGSGAGNVLDALNAREKVGVEANRIAAESARVRGVSTVPSIEGLPDEKFDVVISHHALEHTLQPFLELQGIYRVLRPGGRLLLHLPLDDWRTQKDVDVRDPNHHLYTWTPLLIGNLLKEVGFSGVRCEVVRRAWPGRLTPTLSRLPTLLFNPLCAALSLCVKRQDVVASAVRPKAAAPFGLPLR